MSELGSSPCPACLTWREMEGKKGLFPPTRIHPILGFRHSTAAPFNSYRNRVTVGPRVRSRQAGRVVSWRGSPYQAIVVGVGVGGGGQIRLCLTRVPFHPLLYAPASLLDAYACVFFSKKKNIFLFGLVASASLSPHERSVCRWRD